MIEYIYFVKCPNCDDEPFYFFDEAKEFALGCLSEKPIITQIEVNRNDFGECTDSNDLGTIWSWEETMSDVDSESEPTAFSKDDIQVDYDPETDPEFLSLSDKLDEIPDNFRKPIPDDMTIEDLVEEMEENEDEVECTWCEDLFDKSDCRYEVDLGWLCSRCEAAIKSRGEPLTFRENNYWDFLDEAHDPFDHHDPDYDEDVLVDYAADQIDNAKDERYDDAIDELAENSLEEDYKYLALVDDAKARILDSFRNSYPEFARFITGDTVSVNLYIRSKTASGYANVGKVTDFVVTDRTVEIEFEKNGYTHYVDIDTALAGTDRIFGSLARTMPTYKVVRALRDTIRQLNTEYRNVTGLRDRNAAATLTDEIANEFKEHIISIKYVIPMSDYTLEDMPNDEFFDEYAERACEKLVQIRESFFMWPYADEALAAGMVEDRVIYNKNGDAVDTNKYIATQWRAEGKIYFDCAVDQLSKEAQDVIDACKVGGSVTNDLNSKSIDCIRLSKVLIERFRDVKFYEK